MAPHGRGGESGSGGKAATHLCNGGEPNRRAGEGGTPGARLPPITVTCWMKAFSLVALEAAPSAKAANGVAATDAAAKVASISRRARGWLATIDGVVERAVPTTIGAAPGEKAMAEATTAAAIIYTCHR